MSAAKTWRQWHRWGAVATALPLLVVVASGLVLQLKKDVDWIQPPTQRGSEGAPTIGFAEVLAAARAVPEAEIESWDDVDRLDVRPGKGVIKVRCKNRYEVQLDARTGAVLQGAVRRSDWIESLHDGSLFGDVSKLWIFLPTGLILLFLWASGLYLFVLPYQARARRRAAQNSAASARKNPPT